VRVFGIDILGVGIDLDDLRQWLWLVYKVLNVA
jgi:hypothetical protein